jgi:hypothetical protein
MADTFRVAWGRARRTQRGSLRTPACCRFSCIRGSTRQCSRLSSERGPCLTHRGRDLVLRRTLCKRQSNAGLRKNEPSHTNFFVFGRAGSSTFGCCASLFACVRKRAKAKIQPMVGESTHQTSGKSKNVRMGRENFRFVDVTDQKTVGGRRGLAFQRTRRSQNIFYGTRWQNPTSAAKPQRTQKAPSCTAVERARGT